MRKFVIPLIIIVALAAGFFGGFSYARGGAIAANASALINQALGKPSSVDFGLFWEAWNSIYKNYVEKAKLSTQDMVYGAINGMVDSIGDPYTMFFTPKESKEFEQEIRGAFGGVGIEIGIRNDTLTVISPIKGTPADRAGILAQDTITMIEDKPTDGIKVQDAVNLIRGPKGTSVTITIMRNSFKAPKDITLVRETITVPTVSWRMIGTDTAYLQLYIFNENVDSDFKKAAKEIVDSGAKKIILDLRNNPGGLLDSSVNIAGYFLDPGKVVTYEKFADGTQNAYQTEQNASLKSYPLIVMINKGSASASEILAGALRDNRHIVLVGETSFGKGSVQQINSLTGGTSLKVTVAKWYTPNNYSIDQNGLKPDVSVSLSDQDIETDKDPQLDKAIELIKGL